MLKLKFNQPLTLYLYYLGYTALDLVENNQIEITKVLRENGEQLQSFLHS